MRRSGEVVDASIFNEVLYVGRSPERAVVGSVQGDRGGGFYKTLGPKLRNPLTSSPKSLKPSTPQSPKPCLEASRANRQLSGNFGFLKFPCAQKLYTLAL